MRHANGDWNLPETPTTWDVVQAALLMDIRDRLDRLVMNTQPLTCRNASRIPTLLTKIASNTDRYRCVEHPRYRGILPPRRDCKDCRRMYRRRNA